MTNAVPVHKLTLPEFIEWEKSQVDRHEFIDGEIFAMAGGSPRHNKLTSNLHMVLGNMLRGTPCDILESNQRLSVATESGYVYPDLSIVCGPAEFETIGQGLLNPTVLLEVLSKRTEGFDRGDKFRLYRDRPTLSDYLLVSQRTALIEHYQRQESRWLLSEAVSGSKLTLTGGHTFAVDDVYDGVWRFPTDDES